jgi:hypothetical protein
MIIVKSAQDYFSKNRGPVDLLLCLSFVIFTNSSQVINCPVIQVLSLIWFFVQPLLCKKLVQVD